MSFSDKLSQKADELREKAKEAIAKATEESRADQPRADQQHADHPGAEGPRDEPESYPTDGRQPVRSTPSHPAAEPTVRTAPPPHAGVHDSRADGVRADSRADTVRTDRRVDTDRQVDTARAGTVRADADPVHRHGDEPARFLPAERAQEYTAQWKSLKNDFVDEPRRAVAQADRLVADQIAELQELLNRQRHGIGHGLDSGNTDTEDLRIAMGHYRTLSERLLAL